MKLSLLQNVLIYSMPHSSLFFKAHQEDFGTSKVSEGDHSFVAVRPFRSEEETQFIKAEVHKSLDLGELEVELGEATDAWCVQKDEYTPQVEAAIERCEQEGDKIVLSRIRDVEQPIGSVSAALGKLRDAFPHAFVYLLQTESHGTWIGATPELLIEQNDQEYRAVSLAGTRWGNDPFTEKEINEQATVTQSIIDSLDVPWIRFGEREEVSYGNLRHLQTELFWTADEKLLQYAERLHPTPAVCGFPKTTAYEFIATHEKHDRLLYTGYLGFVNPRERGHLFVNLRCMQLFRNRIRLFAGGGINALSQPENEWEETERKMGAMCDALGLND